MLTYTETKTRSVIKSAVWRIFAVTNSCLVLLLFGLPILQSLPIALAMNVTGFIIFYIYERIWNKIEKGKIVQGSPGKCKNCLKDKDIYNFKSRKNNATN